jgi:flavin-dependent dehydrogenase
MFAAVVVGAGPAGSNAALVLGRYRRRVVVCEIGGRAMPLHDALTASLVETVNRRRCRVSSGQSN